MPKLAPIKHSFSAGELSPRFGCRSDLDVFQKGLKICLNCTPVSQGPIASSRGLQYAGKFPGTKGRMFGFQRSAEESYIVVISDDGNIYVTDETGQTIGPELITNGDFTNGLTGWTTVEGLGSITVVANLLQITSGIILGDTYLYQAVTTNNPDQSHFIIVEMPNDDGNIIELRVGTTANGTDLAQVPGGGTQLTAQFTPNVTEFFVTLWKSVGTTTTKVVNTVNCRASITVPGYTNFPHPWTSDLQLIHAEMPPGADHMYFTHPDFPPQVLEVSPLNVWSFDPVNFTGTPGHWGPKYPRTVTFFQGRSWWGGPGEVMNASQSGSYRDLTTGTQADDGMEYTISERGEIMWLLSLKNLIVGTRTGEHIVTSESGVITPGDIDVEQQSAYGSNYCQPLKLGNKGAYITGDGRKLNDIGYQWTAEQWLSEDLLYTSEHLTQNRHIRELHWAQNPEKVLFGALTDGTAIICLYDPTKEVIGWSRFETSGFLLSACVVEINGISYEYVLIDRGKGEMYLEVATHVAHMDSYKIEYSSTDKNTIDDGIHLANEEVTVLVDGALHPNVTLSDTGTATLQWSGNLIEYGLPYESVIELLPIDTVTEVGSTASFKRRWNKVWLRLHNSVVPKVELITTPDRHPSTLMNISEGPFTGDKQLSTLGYGDGSLRITNDLPFRMIIVGIFGEMEADRI